jgi:hypothetical protein
LEIRAAAYRARAVIDAAAVAKASEHQARMSPSAVPACESSTDEAMQLVTKAAQLRAKLAETAVRNTERAELARRQAKQERARLQEVVRDRDVARDQVVLLRERWLQGFDSAEDSVALGDITRRMKGQQMLLDEYRHALDLSRSERRALAAKLDDRERELRVSIEAADSEQRTRGAELDALRQATEAVATEQRKHMHDLDVARRQAGAVEAELHDATERVTAAKLAVAPLRKRHAMATATLDASRAAAQKKVKDLAALQSRLQGLESAVEHTNELAIAAVRECEAVGLDPDVVLALALKFERDSPSSSSDLPLPLTRGTPDGEGAMMGTPHSAGDAPSSPTSLTGDMFLDMDSAEAVVSARSASVCELQEALHRLQAEVDECETELACLEFEAESAPSQLAAVLETIGFPVPSEAVDEGICAIFDSLEQGKLKREAELRRTFFAFIFVCLFCGPLLCA